MKTESKKHKTSPKKKFDAKAVREILVRENKFITELWDKLNVPVHENNDSDYLKDSSDLRDKNKARLLVTGNKGTARAKTLEELHDKLQALRGKKLGYKEKLMKKRLKNRALKKRKKDERKGKKNLLRTGSDNGLQFENKRKPMKPIYNSEGKMVFSKFDFSESGFKSEGLGKKEREDKDPQKVLKAIEKQNEKLKELEKKGEIEKVTELREKMAWKRALSKAQGVKVKDDPELLKKTIKKDVKRKQKSKGKWDERIEGMKNRQDDKQKKRMDNIQARKKQVKLTKMKKAAKKGRMIPGF